MEDLVLTWVGVARPQVKLQKSMENLNQKLEVERILQDVLGNLRQLSFSPGVLCQL